MQSSLSGSASNLPDSTGRSYTTSFSGQAGTNPPVFHHSGGWFLLLLSACFFNIYVSLCLLFFFGPAGTMQGFNNIHGSYNVPNMPGTLASRNSSISNVPSGGIQQPTGGLSTGRFGSNNFPVALSQVRDLISFCKLSYK